MIHVVYHFNHVDDKKHADSHTCIVLVTPNYEYALQICLEYNIINNWPVLLDAFSHLQKARDIYEVIKPYFFNANTEIDMSAFVQKYGAELDNIHITLLQLLEDRSGEFTMLPFLNIYKIQTLVENQLFRH